ncbi:hypothetical protein CC_1020 [Caulobacter vibrioides CB15]|uniref:Uncharacterized protein n=1 Tax=Caulobacter vibrioides (strain ATCC 19089 / CIP 103742 / CB 15) TaxID=190650 RepID=Q9A9G8_CAUVC|nr:hypothetical protein CC_1020 [Caulobacter vibrioides CB15]
MRASLSRQNDSVLTREALEGEIRRTPGQGKAGLEPAHQNQDDQDHEDQAKAAAGEIAPRPAVPPGGQRADQGQDQKNNENRAEHGPKVPVEPASATVAREVMGSEFAAWLVGSEPKGSLKRVRLQPCGS